MEKPYVVGIDIGGTNTVFGVVDARGTILYSSSIKTGKYTDVDDYVSELANGLKLVIDQAGGVDKIKGIGVGAPNGNFFNGCIEFAPNLPWKGKIPLAQLISEKVGGVPVALTNDANAAAIGEMTYGAARGMKDFIVITLGTGVGSGIVIGGNLVYGHDGFAGELGHVIITDVLVVVVVKVVWKHMLLLQELPVRHANFWKSVRMTACFANWIRTKSHPKTCMTQQ